MEREKKKKKTLTWNQKIENQEIKKSEKNLISQPRKLKIDTKKSKRVGTLVIGKMHKNKHNKKQKNIKQGKPKNPNHGVCFPKKIRKRKKNTKSKECK